MQRGRQHAERNQRQQRRSAPPGTMPLGYLRARLVHHVILSSRSAVVGTACAAPESLTRPRWRAAPVQSYHLKVLSRDDRGGTAAQPSAGKATGWTGPLTGPVWRLIRARSRLGGKRMEHALRVLMDA